MILHSHSIRALAPALAALLLGLVPPAAAAQAQQPQPLPGTAVPVTGVPVPAPGTAPVATPAPATTTSGVIHPGDQLAIAVYPDNTLTQTVVVQNDGTIQFPLVKHRILVAGQTAGEAGDTVAHALAKYVKNPHVTLSVVQQGQISVIVFGNVKNSGKYQVRAGAHLSDAIAAAAGVATVNGDLPLVNVTQQDGAIAHASLQKLLRGGDASQNVELSDNAIVYVTGAETIRVQVVGAVARPGNVEINVGDRMVIALARAGVEAAARPDLTKVTLTRVDPSTGKSTAYTFNAYPGLQGGDQRYNPIMQKDDTIYIPETKQVSPALMGILGLFGRLIGF